MQFLGLVLCLAAWYFASERIGGSASTFASYVVFANVISALLIGRLNKGIPTTANQAAAGLLSLGYFSSLIAGVVLLVVALVR